MPFQKPTNRAEFDKFLSESEQTLVVYFSRSNPSCEKMASMLESLDQSHPGNRFVEIDTAKLKASFLLY
jgi:thiol-disulfide isomerase/thioredoxin